MVSSAVSTVITMSTILLIVLLVFSFMVSYTSFLQLPVLPVDFDKNIKNTSVCLWSSQITDPHRQKHRSLRSLKNNLSAGSPLDFLSAGCFLSEALFFPLWRSEFRRNRGWLVRRARACSQARTDGADTKVVDLRPPSAVFFLFLSNRQFHLPCTRRHPPLPWEGEGSCPAAFFSEELESSPLGGS